MQDDTKEQPAGPQPFEARPELSAVWKELLGTSARENPGPTNTDLSVLPTLPVDPWSVLLQAKGVEVVDLQRVHLQISDQEVEQVLQLMEEHPDLPPPDAKGSAKK